MSQTPPARHLSYYCVAAVGRFALVLLASVVLIASAAGPEEARRATSVGVVDMLDDDLSLWYSWIGVPYPGVRNLPATAVVSDGLDGVPLGRDGLPGVFTLVTMDGRRALKVTGEILGALTTKAYYGDYHLRMQYRWGTAKYPPRKLTQPRDSGILFHLTGSNADAYWSVFMMGLEFQVSERRTGDLLFIGNKDESRVPLVSARADAGKVGWRRDGTLQEVGGRGRNPTFKHLGDYESPHGEWTTVDLYTVGSSGIYLVNGRVVMAYCNARVPMADGTFVPLTQGRIQLQSEGAETYFRDISIRPIDRFPDAIASAAGVPVEITDCIPPRG